MDANAAKALALIAGLDSWNVILHAEQVKESLTSEQREKFLKPKRGIFLGLMDNIPLYWKEDNFIEYP